MIVLNIICGFAFLIALFFLFAFFATAASSVGPQWRYHERPPGLQKGYFGGHIDHKHGQPLKQMTLEQFLKTGESTTVYWDSIKYDTVSSKEELTQLTDYQKTIYKVYND